MMFVLHSFMDGHEEQKVTNVSDQNTLSVVSLLQVSVGCSRSLLKQNIRA